jgi:hypothetical protein
MIESFDNELKVMLEEEETTSLYALLERGTDIALHHF